MLFTLDQICYHEFRRVECSQNRQNLFIKSEIKGNIHLMKNDLFFASSLKQLNLSEQISLFYLVPDSKRT